MKYDVTHPIGKAIPRYSDIAFPFAFCVGPPLATQSAATHSKFGMTLES
jgi:hypothetical protein